MTKEFRLTIFHDDGPERPGDEDDFLTLYSFNSRHINSADPDEIFACVECGESRDTWTHPEYVPDPEDPYAVADTAEWRDEDPESMHPFRGREGWVLSYFEHGLCKWGRAGTMGGMPDFQWDGVGVAGFLEVKPETDGEDRSWWDDKTPEDRDAIADGFLEEYTSWCNGEVYGYRLERIGGKTCDLGFFHEEDATDEDSCFGFIGWDYFLEEVSRATHDMGATEDNTKIVDRCYGQAENEDAERFFQVEKEEEEVSK